MNNNEYKYYQSEKQQVFCIDHIHLKIALTKKAK